MISMILQLELIIICCYKFCYEITPNINMYPHINELLKKAGDPPSTTPNICTLTKHMYPHIVELLNHAGDPPSTTPINIPASFLLYRFEFLN